MAGSRTKSWFPTTSNPLIVNAPMLGVASPKLASEVTKASGLGFIQGGLDFTPGCEALKTLESQLTQARELLGLEATAEDSKSDLPIGVGFLLFGPSVLYFGETVTPILRRHHPAAIWLFAPSPSIPDTIPTIISAVKSAIQAEPTWNPKVVVQVGSVAAARESVQHGADIIVAQGIDAGGHQWASGAGFVTLLPEIADMVRDEFPDRQVALWAAGGIVDGRGVAAAVALGAEGAVLGTRFIVASESGAADYTKTAVLAASDGGASTVKSTFHDYIRSDRSWPELYDGRAIINPSVRDHQAGLSLDENIKLFKAAQESGDTSRMVTWSGTGVGLVKEAIPAAEITRKARDDANKIIANLKTSL
ncbi:hypothetical protein M426DRAFT_325196 [Hypoxylon sp. CI-4A]|nr:hypothetical protein M426DRAFT_325196 [Hypoxylon sp. CI-4A]